MFQGNLPPASLIMGDHRSVGKAARLQVSNTVRKYSGFTPMVYHDVTKAPHPCIYLTRINDWEPQIAKL